MKKLAPIAMLFIMLVFMLLTFATPASAIPIISEPSFETVADWTYSESETAFTDGARSGTWKTQGDWSYMFSTTDGVSTSYNAYCQILQSVDFTKLDTISFDAYLYCAKTNRFKASVFVDASEVWTTDCPLKATVYLHEEIDVSGYSGSHNLIFRITCIRAQGTSQPQTNYFDNIKTWGSFSDSAHTTVWGTVANPYDSDTHVVYMYGEGLTVGHAYHVGYYDGSGTYKQASETGTLVGTSLSSQYDCTSYAAQPGTWHAVVFDDAGGSPPETYGACSGAPGYIVEDDFEVNQDAIPEFPTVIAAIAVCMLCAVAYMVMRRRAEKG